MPFIGNQPALAYTSFAKQDFTTSATTNYVLDQAVTNANEIALFINFVRQEPTTAYTATGTALTLTSATTAGDDMYCIFLGKAVGTINPPAGSVGASQIIDGSITSAKLSGVTQGITMQDMWRLSANYSKSGSGTVDLTSNWERVDSNGYAQIGTGMTESSGIFTFPLTGIYHISFKGNVYATGGAIDYLGGIIYVTTDNSTYNNSADGFDSSYAINGYGNFSTELILDVTSTSTHKVKFANQTGGNSILEGSTNINRTSVLFIRLGDT